MVVGTILLLASYALPVESMSEHLSDSASIFEKEGTYPALSELYPSTLDNFTDSKMLLASAYPGTEPLMEKAMMGYSHRLENGDPVETLVAEYSYDGNSEDLGNIMTTEYSRYWQGYLVILKPLLCLFDYGTIRILNGVVQVIVVLVVAMAMARKGQGIVIAPFILSIIALSPTATALSLQYSSVFYISMFATYFIVVKREVLSGRQCAIFFFLIGMATSYFDFLTYPVMSLGFPLVVMAAFRKSDSPRSAFVFSIAMILVWFLGYGGMWALKWVIASIAMNDSSIFSNALNQVSVRSSINSDVNDQHLVQMGILDGLISNIQVFLSNPLSVFSVLVGLLCCVIGMVWGCYFSHAFRQVLPVVLPLAVAFSLPMLWYLAMGNHSCIHAWFTFRDLSVALFALLVAASIILQSCFQNSGTKVLRQ